MQNPSAELYKALREKLVVTYQGASVPVYVGVPKGATYPHILLDQLLPGDFSTKTGFLTEGSILIEAVTQQANVSKIAAETIANSIMQILVPSPSGNVSLSLTNFTLVDFFYDDGSEFTDETDTQVIYRKQLRFIFTLQEN
jgi:hypothetical protein